MKYNRMVIFQNVANVEHNIQFWFNFREIAGFRGNLEEPDIAEGIEV